MLWGQRLRTEGKYIVNANNEEVILRGYGLGGWMLMEGYMMHSSDVADTQHEFRARLEDLMGVEKTDEFFDAWLANHVTKRDIDSLAAWGFNSIRLPMHYNLFTLPIEEEPVAGQNTWLNKGFDMVDELLLWCKENSIYLILDLHAAPGGQGENAAISDYDPSKPSLWESKANRDKTVALWTKLAERYKDEDWIGGYDLINETNWYKADMGSNNALLKQLSVEITNSIRATGDDHIIFIEGNGFANDFTGMTPPWDDNMAYSFHKYWSYNDTGSIQWVLNIRNQHNVPLWMGEGGENSNPWFTDAISLFEENKIGWSWWPMKRIETIVGPYSIKFTQGYKNILAYWRGQVDKPTVDQAYTWMMELATMTNSANCDYQKDVHDAMIRQPHTEETIPFEQVNLPGTVFMTNFDLGRHGIAYFDTDYANYGGSTGSFAFWNQGWWYRNDAVDIEKTSIPGGNGFNIGFIEKGEWLNYTVTIDQAGVYDIDLQFASTQSGAKFHIGLDGADVTPIYSLGSTGGWTDFEMYQVNGIILPAGTHTITFYMDGGASANFSRMDFKMVSEIVDLPFEILTAKTGKAEETIKLSFNYMIDPATLSGTENDFELAIDNVRINPTQINYDVAEPYTIELVFDTAMHYTDMLLLDYSGSAIKDLEGKTLELFSELDVLNELDTRWVLPGLIQAEAYTAMSGFREEACDDTGKGVNLGYADPGDFADYSLRIKETKEYDVNFRVASQSFQGRVKLILIDNQQEETELGTYSFSATGGWQEWETFTNKIALPAGDFTLRIQVISGGFNLNWFSFRDVILAVDDHEVVADLAYPNPTKGRLSLLDPSFSRYLLRDFAGRIVQMGKVENRQVIIGDNIIEGHYILSLVESSGTRVVNQKIVLSR